MTGYTTRKHRCYLKYMHKWLPEDRNSSIIDIGCGKGWMLHLLKTEGYQNIEGIDIDSDSVLEARTVVDNVRCDDCINYLSQNVNKYDLILAIDVIEHLKKVDSAKFLHCCFNSLRDGGSVIVQTPNAESPFSLGIRYGDVTHETAYTPGLLKEMMEEYGFSGIVLREQGPTVHSFFSAIRSVLWKILRLKVVIWNLIETGSSKSGIASRVFIAIGSKKQNK